MPQNGRPIIEKFAISRKNLIELIIVVVLIAFGTNLIAGQWVSSDTLNPLINIILGILFPI